MIKLAEITENLVKRIKGIIIIRSQANSSNSKYLK